MVQGAEGLGAVPVEFCVGPASYTDPLPGRGEAGRGSPDFPHLFATSHILYFGSKLIFVFKLVAIINLIKLLSWLQFSEASPKLAP